MKRCGTTCDICRDSTCCFECGRDNCDERCDNAEICGGATGGARQGGLPPIVAADFDGTIVTDAYPLIGEPISETIEALKRRRDGGAKVILWTCRCGAELDAAITWCEGRGIFFDAINANLPEAIALFGGDPRKVHADEYWDDKAVVKNREVRQDG